MSDDLASVPPLEPGASRARRVRTPTVLQMEAVECGAAALAIVLGYYGRFVPLERLRIECGVSRDGSKAGNMARAARSYGLRAQGKKQDPRPLLESYAFPLIVHWNLEHFLVVEGCDRTWVYLNDPACGPRRVAWEEFESCYTGVALAFQPGPDFQPGGQRPNLIRSLRPRLRGSETALTLVVLVSLMLVVPGLILPTVVRTFVDRVLVGGLQGWLGPLLLGLAVTAITQAGLLSLRQHYLRRLETRFSLSTSARFLWHVLRLPMEFYEQRYAGDIGSRVGLNDQLALLLSGKLATAMLNLVVVALFLCLMLSYDLGLTLTSLVLAAFNLLTLQLVSRARKDGNSRLLQEEAKLIGTATGGLQIIETLKATASESDFFARWAGYQARALNVEQELGIYTRILQVVPMCLSMLNTSVILTLGAQRVIGGTMTVGMLVAFQTLASSFMQPINQLVELGGDLQEATGNLARLDDVLHYEAVPEPQQPQGEAARLSGRLELRDLTFGYSPLSRPLLEGFNLVLNPGDRVALVGGTGSGKSTTAALVAGLRRPWSGQILLDGQPRESLPREVLTGSLGHVSQDIVLFQGTLRENLTLWDPTVPEASLVRAARDACIHADIVGRPEGYDGQVDEGGSNFSGGQRQRLEIARALVGNPSILVLDEATSALDPIVEQEIDDNLRRRGCTCLIVAHRLSTIRDCDEILVLDRGQVVERGTHDHMMQNDGPYARLIRAELAGAP